MTHKFMTHKWRRLESVGRSRQHAAQIDWKPILVALLVVLLGCHQEPPAPSAAESTRPPQSSSDAVDLTERMDIASDEAGASFV